MLNKIEQAIKELENSKEKQKVEVLIDEAYHKVQQQLQQNYCDGNNICYLVEEYIERRFDIFKKSLNIKVEELIRKETFTEITDKLSDVNSGLVDYNRILKIVENMEEEEIAYQEEFKEVLVRICASYIFDDKEKQKVEAEALRRLWRIIVEDPEEGYF